MREMRRENVWLNNVSLREVDPRIINIRLIEETQVQDIAFARPAAKDGRLALARRAVSKKISVEFMIRALYDLTTRASVIDAVNRWAGDGGILTASTRPDQRIRVIPTSYAAAGDIRDYNAALRLDFETTAAPCWESLTPVTYIAGTAATSGSGTLSIPGNAETCADAIITPSAALTWVSVAVGNEFIHLNGIDLAAGTPVRIWHDDTGILRITAGASNTSLMSARTAASSDDLTAGPGNVAVSFEANTACTVQVSARGRFR